jgi:uncharacterized protein (TIGR04206 family)
MSRRLAVLCSLAVLPWIVVVYPGEADFVFGWGLLNTNPFHVVHLYDYLFVHTLGPRALPDHLLAWPVSFSLYLAALASGFLSFVDREDRRLTAGLLLVAALASLRMWWGLSTIGLTVLPLGAIAMVVTVWWFHAADLRRMLPAWEE